MFNTLENITKSNYSFDWIWLSREINPFNYGCSYDSINHLSFNLFMFKRMKVCFGTEFFGDVGIVEYDGNHYRNKRNRCRWLCDNKNEWYMSENG